MRKFLLGLVAYGCALSLLGGGLGVSEASAKTVFAKCVRPSAKLAYPHWAHSRVRCYAPGFWVRVRYKDAIRWGTWPVIL